MSTSPVDPFANPPAPGLFFWAAQWSWVVKIVQILHAEHEAELAELGAIRIAMEGFMTQEADLTAAVAANTKAVADLTASIAPLTTAVTTAVADVDRLVKLLNAGPTLSPAIAQAILDVTASNTALTAASTALATDTSSLTTAEAPVPPA